MQVLHPTTGGLYTGLTNAVSTIYRIEGWRTLWKGVSSVIVGAGKMHISLTYSGDEERLTILVRQVRRMPCTLVLMRLSRKWPVEMSTKATIRLLPVSALNYNSVDARKVLTFPSR
jgi:hypothetical protein